MVVGVVVIILGQHRRNRQAIAAIRERPSVAQFDLPFGAKSQPNSDSGHGF